MKRTNNRRHYSSSRNNRKKEEAVSTRLGNQISGAIILCVFILIIAYTNSSITGNMRTKMTAIISRNVIDEFEDKGNLKDNIVSAVKTVFSKEEETKDVIKTETEPIISNMGDEDEANVEDTSTEEPSQQDVPPK